MDFVTGLTISINWKRETYDLILVIVNYLIKMVYYKPIKVLIDAPSLTEVIIDIVIRYYSLPNSIISDQGPIFNSKFWFSQCYFLGIKQKSLLHFTYKQTVKAKDKITLWQPTFDLI